MFTSVQIWFQRTVSPFSAERYNVLAHERLRLYTLLTIALLKLMNFFGGAWDIQWHVTIGRDSAWIPPHLMVLTAFVGGLTVVLVALAYESYLSQSGVELKYVVRVGAIRAPAALFGIYFGYTGALLSGLFDEIWHRTFGIDATLWSPPHLSIMLSTLIVDMSLLLGIAAAAKHLDWKFEPRSPFFWGLILAGSYTFESVCFQMSEAFIAGYRVGGAGLMGILFPILVGVIFPLPLLVSIRLSGRFWTAILIFAMTILLQYVGIGIAAAGFAILQPVSAIEDFVRDNPESTIAVAREFTQLTGSELIGFKQAWTVWLSALPLGLVSVLGLWPWARRNLWVAAPVYSTSLVLAAYIWFQWTAPIRDYPTTLADVTLGVGVAVVGGLIFGRVGLWVAR